MIFIALGSQKFQFNRLLRAVDHLIESGVINEEVFAQTGYSDYKPEYYAHKDFLNREEYAKAEAKANIVITHGGTGAIIGALKKGKKVIAVPRFAKYGEHVDDHQVQLLKQFEEMNIISVCYNIEELGRCYLETKNKTFNEYHSNTKAIIASIEEYLESENLNGKTSR